MKSCFVSALILSLAFVYIGNADGAKSPPRASPPPPQEALAPPQNAASPPLEAPFPPLDAAPPPLEGAFPPLEGPAPPLDAAGPLVPALFIFGDGTGDVGNNNYLHTIFRADHPPYGRDFPNQEPTGRFSNGKLALDFTAETLGFTSYPAAYLSPEASGDNLLIGANFASAASGFDDRTASLSRVIPLSQQLEYFREYKDKLEMVAGEKASSIIEGAIFVLSTGSSDFVQNYYVNPLLNRYYTVNEYSSQLINIFSKFTQDLYEAGARKLGVSALPPIGCAPATRSLFGFGQPGCVLWLNNVAKKFNQKLNTTTVNLKKRLPDMKIAVFDVFEPLLSLVNSPEENGFFESGRACCGTGTVETTLLCNPRSLGTCANASGYVFWDAISPSETANKFLADSLIFAGLSLL